VSDLFNEGKYDKSFDANEFVRSICENTKITIHDHINIQFLPGWKSIVENFIQSVKSYPINLIYINDSYFMLDIEFAVLKQTREVNIWRAVNEARNESKNLCAACGAYKRRLQRDQVSTMFCEACLKDVAAVGKTGTWIDKY